MSDSCLILNATAVNEGRVFETDLLVRSGRIEKIGAGLSGEAADTVLDAAGLHLLPGMIDDQVHFRDYEQSNKGTLQSESRAAVAGGTTSVMDMPNNQPSITTAERLDEKIARADGAMHTNYAFYFGATNTNMEEVRRLDPAKACGVKVFMGASTGDLLVDEPEALEQHFAASPVLIATHCEDNEIIEMMLEKYAKMFGDDIPLEKHARIRPRSACLSSSTEAMNLARRHDARLHVLHLTTADEMEMLTSGPVEDKRITTEVCVHHMIFTEDDYDQYGGRIKCNPSIKTRTDRDALREAVRADKIDVIATDHAPHLLSEKEGRYREIAAGLPMTQHALPMVLELVHQGVFDLAQAVHKTSHAPALCYGVRDRGFLREGYFADLVLVDLSAPVRLAPEEVLHRCGWSAFEGREVHARIDATWVSGKLAYRDGQGVSDPCGMRLEFNRD